MSTATYISSSDNLAVKAWAAEIWDHTKYVLQLQGMMGGMNAPIYEFESLGKGDGDKVTYPLVLSNEDNPVIEGNQYAEGREAQTKTKSASIELKLIRYVQDYENKMNLFRLKWDLPNVVRDQVAMRMAVEIERRLMDAAQTSITHQVYPDLADAVLDDITADDYITPDQVSRAKYLALRGAGQTSGDTSVGTRPRFRPISVPGFGEYLILWVHEYVAYGMIRNSEWQQAVREAQLRGPQNPLFTGAIGIWDGVVIKTHPMINEATTASSVTYATNFLCGAQGLGAVWGQRPEMIIAEKDYKRITGVCYEMVFGAGKPQFEMGDGNTYDYAILGVPSAFHALTAPATAAS